MLLCQQLMYNNKPSQFACSIERKQNTCSLILTFIESATSRIYLHYKSWSSQKSM